MNLEECKAENERLRELYLDFLDSFPNAKERIAWRVRTDNERGLAAKQGRLYDWTVNVYWPEIERKVEMAKGTTRGRPKKTTQAETLLNAIKFVEVASGSFEDWQKFVSLSNKQIVAFNGQIAAGHPIVEEIDLCPQLERLKAALTRCGKTLVISETPTGALSIKGDKLRAVVPCVPGETLPPVVPDAEQGPIGDIVKEAFKVCGTLASEAGTRVVEASLLLEANSCTGTNGAAIMQFWHGVSLPMNIVIPKAFSEAVAKTAKPLRGVGFSWGEAKPSSMTVYFDDGAWIKTQCYADDWPEIGHLLNVASNPTEAPEELFEAVEAVSKFNDNETVIFADGYVISHASFDVGAQYEVKGLQGGKKFDAKLIKQVVPFVKTIDLTSAEDRVYFFGGEPSNPIRGVVMAMKSEPIQQPAAPPEQQFTRIETVEEPEADDESDDAGGWTDQNPEGWGNSNA